MDWLSFAGSIIGGLIGGIFTYFGVRLTLKHDDKKIRDEEIRKAIENRPRLELVEYKECKQIKPYANADLNALILHIENVEFDNFGTRFVYDKKVLEPNNLVCCEYLLKNTGNTEIEGVALVSSLPKDTVVIEYSIKEIYVNEQLLNYTVWSNKNFIKPNDTVLIKIHYLKDKIVTGFFGCPCALYLRDVNGRYWHQPLFAPNNETDNSILCSSKDFKDATDIDIALKCFRGELPW